MCPDEWMDALGIDLWDQPARARVEALQWSQTLDAVRLGMTVIVEWGLWSRAERDIAREEARAAGAAVELRFLDVARDELWRRLAVRNETPGPAWTRHRAVVARRVVAAVRATRPDELAGFDPA